jgi:phosphoribosyl 1,2-cyclic phosphate phosphodiesterase
MCTPGKEAALDSSSPALYAFIQMELEILGSGTSHGIPVIGCACPVCTSKDPRDNRMRASAVMRGSDGSAILIDAGPEFRLQALRTGLKRLDAVLLTHTHADHIHGLDDLRIFTVRQDMKVYIDEEFINEVQERFSYIFRETQEGGGKPHLELIPVTGGREIVIAGRRILPIPIFHGSISILGWRCGDTAYLTDCSGAGESSLELLSGVKKLVIGALRERPHSTHFNFAQAAAFIEKINPDEAWFTHICHDFSHTQIQAWLAHNVPGKKIEPAFDGLRISIKD